MESITKFELGKNLPSLSCFEREEDDENLKYKCHPLCTLKGAKDLKVPSHQIKSGWKGYG